MSAEVVGRSAEFRAIADFLASVDTQPSGLLMEGEAGIGKTTLWLAAVELARERGFRVLTARAWEPESVLSYATVADLLCDIDPDVVALPEIQCLDPSSWAVVSFAARRLRPRAGLLVTERTEPGRSSVLSWLHLATPDGIGRINVRRLSIAGLHQVFSTRLGRSFPRPTIVRIAEVSGGNPFYALEMARAINDKSTHIDADLPRTLADLVRMRIGHLNADAGDVLLAAACTADPTVDMLARATGTTVERTTELLDDLQTSGVVAIEGNRVRYSHPLLTRGVYSNASPARRRQMHRTLADVVAQPELRARHLAHAASSEDPDLLQALDDAANTARARGAHAEAAELLDLAIKLGGDTPLRRLRSADHHFRAGDIDQAHAVLTPGVESWSQGRCGRSRGICLPGSMCTRGVSVRPPRFSTVRSTKPRAIRRFWLRP